MTEFRTGQNTCSKYLQKQEMKYQYDGICIRKGKKNLVIYQHFPLLPRIFSKAYFLKVVENLS